MPSDALPVPLRPASHTAAAQTGTLQYVPEAMIDEVLPIVIDDDYVLCNGGDDTLVGHPIEMIKVDSPWPAVCKYCGLRYINKDMAAKNAEWAFLVGVRMRSFFSKCWPKSACQPPPVRSSLIWRCHAAGGPDRPAGVRGRCGGQHSPAEQRVVERCTLERRCISKSPLGT